MHTIKTANYIGNTSVIKRKWQTAGIIMAAPAMIVIITFIFLPLIMNIGYAFTNYNLNSIVPKFTGLTNFRNILRDPDFWLVCKNTLVLALVYVLGLNTIAIIVSVMIAKLSVGLGNAIKSVLYFPCLLAMVVVGYI